MITISVCMSRSDRNGSVARKCELASIQVFFDALYSFVHGMFLAESRNVRIMERLNKCVNSSAA